MEKVRTKILKAEEAQEYIYLTFKIKGEKIQVASKDRKLLELADKEVFVSKPEGKDYIIEPVK